MNIGEFEANNPFLNADSLHHTFAQSSSCLNRLRLVKEDLPEAYASRREIQLQKREIAKLLERDIEQKLNSAFEV